jgi:HD superfamily phosphohydrolase
LDEKESIELMMACLYHDVGTPPFAHAMEEVLQAKFGFDHEENLKNIILGTTGEYDGDLVQIYMGKLLKLKSVCQSRTGRSLKLDLQKIALLTVGDKSQPLSPLINGNGIDLDNIDNVVRASSAMGISFPENMSGSAGSFAVSLAHSFTNENNQICYNALHINEIRNWQMIRDLQYSAIFESVVDFSYQSMIKKAVGLLFDNNSTLNVNAWRFTDSEIINEYLLKTPQCAEIMERVLLCKPYHCLTVLYVSGNNVSKYINSHLSDIEDVASLHYVEKLSVSEKKLNTIPTKAVIANFFPDKRKRRITALARFGGKEYSIDSPSESPQGALLGFFTPFDSSNHLTLEENGKRVRKTRSYGQDAIHELIALLSENCLKDYKISIFRSNDNGATDQHPQTNQLGLF